MLINLIKYLEIQRAAEGEARNAHDENEGSKSKDPTRNTKQLFNGAVSQNITVIWGIN